MKESTKQSSRQKLSLLRRRFLLPKPRRVQQQPIATILLTGILFDKGGNGLRSVHTKKGDVRYRYYVSKACVEERGRRDHSSWRLPARQIEQVVEVELARLLSDGRRLSELLQNYVSAERISAAITKASEVLRIFHGSSPQYRRAVIRRLFPRIELASVRLVMHLDLRNLSEELVGATREMDGADQTRQTTIERPIALRRRGKETKIILTDQSQHVKAPDQNLIKMLRKAHFYLAQLTDGSGRSMSEIAAVNKVDRSDFRRVLQLAFLAPAIVDQIVTGTQPADLTARKLSRLTEFPNAWIEQKVLLAS